MIIKLKSLGYKVKPYSGWVGDDGKFFFGGETSTVGWIDVNKKEVSPIYGFYGGYLKKVAKILNYTLIE